MAGKRPEDDEPIDADVVEEEEESTSTSDVEEHPVEPPRDRPPYSGYRPRQKKSPLGEVMFLLGLAAVAVLAITFRKELTDAYDRYLGGPEGPQAKVEPVRHDEAVKWEPKLPAPVEPKVETPTTPVEETPLPKFERREKPTLPREEPPVIPHFQPRPGLAYSIVERKDATYKPGLFQYEFKVIVPENYKKDDLLRMGLDIIEYERKQGLRHAILIYCFKDKTNLDPDEAYAEVIWAPGGNYMRAADALRFGPDNNEYRVIIKK